MSTPKPRGPRSRARKLELIANRIANFPSVEALHANPEPILTGPFKPEWAHNATLIEKADQTFANLFQPQDLDQAVVLTFKHTPDKMAVRMDLLDYIFLTALTLPGGSVYLNHDGKQGQPYVRCRGATHTIDQRERSMGPIPVARLLLDLGAYEGATYADGNRFNLMRSNLVQQGFGRCDKSLSSFKLFQRRASGWNKRYADLLDEIEAHNRSEHEFNRIAGNFNA